MIKRSAVRKFLAAGEAITFKDHDGAEFHKDGDRWIATLSTPDVDCDGDRVRGWEWDGETLPLMAAHDHGSLPVGLVRPFVDGEALKGELIFPAMGTTVAADEARRLVEGGILKAVSIGFAGMGKQNELDGVDFERVKVKEVSLVGVGCCDSAKIEGRAKCACKRKAPDAATSAAAVDPPSAGHAVAPGALRAALDLIAKAISTATVKDFPPKDEDADAEKIECPNCGAMMTKGGKCEECGYVDKGKSAAPDRTKIHSPKIQKEGDKWKVVDDDGKVYGTHDSEAKAQRQLAALEANKTAHPSCFGPGIS